MLSLLLLAAGAACGGSFATVSTGAARVTLPAATMTNMEAITFIMAPTTLARLTAGTDQDIVAYVASEAKTARSHLNTDAALAILRDHQATQDHAKWWNVGLSAVSTIVGMIATNQTKNHATWTVVTGGLGAATTSIIAVRDDKDIATRIGNCLTVAQDGNSAIDTFEAKWDAAAINAPAAGSAERKQFIADIGNDGETMIKLVDKLNGACH